MDTFPGPEHWLEHHVSYGETDCMGYMYYGEYFHLFERGRSAFIRGQGMSYARVEEQGVYLPVREAQCRYRSPAHYDDLLRVRVRVGEWGRASITFQYEVRCEDRLICTGMTQHACVNKAGRPTAVPDWLKEPCSSR